MWNWRELLARLKPPPADLEPIAREAERIVHGLDRRAFLKSALLATTAATTVDIAKLLWTPNPQIVVPPAPLIHAFLRGDVFTIAHRYACNPTTRRPTQHLQQFVVTADVTEGQHLTGRVVYPPLIGRDAIIDSRTLNIFGGPAHGFTPLASRVE